MLERALEVARLEARQAGAGRDEVGHREPLAACLDPIAHRLRLPDQRPVVRPDAGPAADRADRRTRERGGLLGEPLPGGAKPGPGPG